MVKAALVLLVEEGKPAVKIFEKLDGVVRSSGDNRAFVTSTLAVINTRNGRMELTNAGHPPTYVLRDGEVRELLLTGSPPQSRTRWRRYESNEPPVGVVVGIGSSIPGTPIVGIALGVAAAATVAVYGRML